MSNDRERHRPGVMLYFDLLPSLQLLPLEDVGKLVIAILEYGQYGVIPEFEGVLALTWSFILPQLDRDAERYERILLASDYANACKRAKALGEPSPDREEYEKWWYGQLEPTGADCYRSEPVGAGRNPTTTTTSSTTSTATTPTTPTTTPTTDTTPKSNTTPTTTFTGEKQSVEGIDRGFKGERKGRPDETDEVETEHRAKLIQFMQEVRQKQQEAALKHTQPGI